MEEEALVEGATVEDLTLATPLGGRSTEGSSSADKGVDSFVDRILIVHPCVIRRRNIFIRAIEENMDHFKRQ
jgi:hypothetical protein